MNNLVKSLGNKQIPIGVKVLAIIYYMFSVLLLGSAVYYFIFGSMFLGGGILGMLIMSLGYFVAALAIGAGVLNFFIGRGLWNGKNWARIFVLVISWLAVIASFFSLFSGNFTSLIILIIYGVIIWYMQFRKEVKDYFTKS